MAFLPAPSLPTHPNLHLPHRPPICLGGSRLPRSAYTTLQADDTPICRLITGMWQLPHASVTEVTHAIHSAIDAGFSTFDMASMHGEAELFAREYARTVGRAASRRAQFCTTLVLDPRSMHKVTRRFVEQHVDRSLKRMGQERIHLFQVQWGDFEDGRYVDFMGYLGEMKSEGKIRSIGTANFPTSRLRYLQSQGISVASNQVSFSLLDRRPIVEMADWCRQNDVALLAYSTLGAGFISERYVGMPEPSACTPSLQRFKTLIRVWGGWSLFQELLYAVKGVAEKYDVSMANVAVKWALQHPALAAVVVSTRLGDLERTRSHVRAFEFSLEEEDIDMLDRVAMKGNDMYRILGDCGNEMQVNRRNY